MDNGLMRTLVETASTIAESREPLNEGTTLLSSGMNEQYNYELHSALIYEQLANQSRFLGYTGAACYFQEAATEELKHAHMFANTMQDLETMPAIRVDLFEKINTPRGFTELIQSALLHEKEMSARIKQLLKASREVDDFNTEKFLIGFVDEQIEEEAKLQDILDRINAFNGSDKTSLLIIDKELKEMAEEA